VYLPAPGGAQGSGGESADGAAVRSGGTRILLRWRRPPGIGDTLAAPLAGLALAGAALLSGGLAGLAGSAVALAGVRLIGEWSLRRDRAALLELVREALEARAIVLDRTEQERLAAHLPRATRGAATR
jgi:hypothetical protein